MSDPRDVFGVLIGAVGAARASSPPKRGIRLEVLARLLTHERVSQFLWDAHKKLMVGESLQWGDFEVEKAHDHLTIRVLYPGSKRGVYRTFLLSTNGKGLREETDTKKIVARGLSGPLLFAESVARVPRRRDLPQE